MKLKGIHKCMSILYDVCLVLESSIRGYLAARYSLYICFLKLHKSNTFILYISYFNIVKNSECKKGPLRFFRVPSFLWFLY